LLSSGNNILLYFRNEKYSVYTRILLKNPFISVDSTVRPKHETIGDSSKVMLLNSLKNTRKSNQKIFETTPFLDSDYIVVLLDGAFVEETAYSKVDGNKIEMKESVSVKSDFLVYKSSLNVNVTVFNSLKTETAGVTNASFFSSVFHSLNKAKKNDRIYKMEYNGTNIFSSNVKIGNNHFVLIDNSEYYLVSGDGVESGEYPNCKEYAKVFSKANEGYCILFGSLEYRDGKNYLVEGVLI
jgi:hypothetical protein